MPALTAERQASGVEPEVMQPAPGLKEFAGHHLVMKARSGEFTADHLAAMEQRLNVAIEFFDEGRPVDTIGVEEVRGFAAALRERPRRKPRQCPTCGTTAPHLAGRQAMCRSAGCAAVWTAAGTSPGTVKHYLNAMSNLFRRAQEEGIVAAGHNPVTVLMEGRPRPRPKEAHWLETHDAALLLEAARTFKPKRSEVAMPYAYPLIATYLLTGGREKEVLGLEVDDVSFDRGVITFRPNRWRRLKTITSHRSVPLWPQLREILQQHLYGGEQPRVTGLLFPSVRGEDQSMIRDARKMLDAVAERAGWKAGEIRTKAFRHTYTATRLQTLDRGAPVSVYTVAKELGPRRRRARQADLRPPGPDAAPLQGSRIPGRAARGAARRPAAGSPGRVDAWHNFWHSPQALPVTTRSPRPRNLRRGPRLSPCARQDSNL